MPGIAHEFARGPRERLLEDLGVDEQIQRLPRRAALEVRAHKRGVGLLEEKPQDNLDGHGDDDHEKDHGDLVSHVGGVREGAALEVPPLGVKSILASLERDSGRRGGVVGEGRVAEEGAAAPMDRCRPSALVRLRRQPTAPHVRRRPKAALHRPLCLQPDRDTEGTHPVVDENPHARAALEGVVDGGGEAARHRVQREGRPCEHLGEPDHALVQRLLRRGVFFRLERGAHGHPYGHALPRFELFDDLGGLGSELPHLVLAREVREGVPQVPVASADDAVRGSEPLDLPECARELPIVTFALKHPDSEESRPDTHGVIAVQSPALGRRQECGGGASGDLVCIKDLGVARTPVVLDHAPARKDGRSKVIVGIERAIEVLQHDDLEDLRPFVPPPRSRVLERQFRPEDLDQIREHEGALGRYGHASEEPAGRSNARRQLRARKDLPDGHVREDQGRAHEPIRPLAGCEAGVEIGHYRPALEANCPPRLLRFSLDPNNALGRQAGLLSQDLDPRHPLAA
mmetsp:Transcript_37407/g.117807  ORF Transcript_37407/g.117807 Transcript_37407/m.117807 type:complete len:515 (+) Transcript_37407:2416-3960(+)